MTKNYFISGEFNLYCDVCSKKIKAHEAKHRWDGLIVCEKDYETRQPQDFVRARQDQITVPFSRPVEARTLTNITYINIYMDADYIEDYETYIKDPDL